MIKSQNTKNEQQKDLCITSEQLTGQWKKGELPSGLYWVKGSRTKGIYAYTAEYLNNMYRPRNGERIIEQVPSYEQWQASENYIDYLKQCISVYESKDKQATETSIAYNELLEENTKLKERNDSLNNRDINLCRIANGIRDENFALKELLKECRPALVRFVAYDDSEENARILLMNKINEVLK